MPIDGVVFGLHFEKIRIICDSCKKYVGGGYTIASMPDTWKCRSCGFVMNDLLRKVKALARPLPITKKTFVVAEDDTPFIIKNATKVPDVVVEGDEVIIPTREITRFRWAKIYGEWTIVEFNGLYEEDEFFVIGSEEVFKTKNYKDLKDLEWGDWILPPQEKR